MKQNSKILSRAGIHHFERDGNPITTKDGNRYLAIGDTLLQGPLNAKAGIRALSALQIQRNHTTKLDETEELGRVELSQQENGQPISSLILQECPNE